MTKQKTPSEAKTLQIHVRATPTKKKEMQERAKGLNLTLSQMLMKCYEDSKDNDFGFN
jgi:hypothetical protein|tara:strand:+ start:4632 stop:4805 length:174 start_codon:yes stop_codon:yes gene_type:complete